MTWPEVIHHAGLARGQVVRKRRTGGTFPSVRAASFQDTFNPVLQDKRQRLNLLRMGITLRAATLDDLSLLALLVQAHYESAGFSYEEGPAREALQQLVTTARLGRVWWVDSEGAPIGYVVLTFSFSVEFHGQYAVLDEVYLVPGHQGKGHFKHLLALVEAHCWRWGIRTLRLEVETNNARAQRAYQKAGFAAHGRALMTKRLG
ncbi:MAG: GNAT family N-acetyltransferase [Chloroflexi bacterium]|nr:GNAT family N-acetyltransferase [Chloroflexota bacterium]